MTTSYRRTRRLLGLAPTGGLASIRERLAAAVRGWRGGETAETRYLRLALVRDRALSAALMAAVNNGIRVLHHQLDASVTRLPNDTRLPDDLERAIFGVDDIRPQDELRGLLRQLDDSSDRVRATFANVSVYEWLDPVKAIAVDLASGSLWPLDPRRARRPTKSESTDACCNRGLRPSPKLGPRSAVVAACRRREAVRPSNRQEASASDEDGQGSRRPPPAPIMFG